MQTKLLTIIQEAGSKVLPAIQAYRAGRISASNSAHKCRLIIFFDCGIPKAVAIVSPENDGSNTTRPP